MMTLFPKKQRKDLRTEHGDWRLPSEHPAEAEHLPPCEPTVWRRMHLRARYLQTLPAYSTPAYTASDGLLNTVRPIRGAARFFRLAVAWLVLLPLSILLVFALLENFYNAGDTVSSRAFWVSVPVWYSLLGVGSFVSLVVTRLAMPVLIYIYVMGHELTHALATVCCMGKVHKLNIDIDGGYVETTKDNLFIALSPYFIPFWMCCWMGVLWVAHLVRPAWEWGPWFYAGLGFWWGFHLYWTAWVIPREQPDMLENGLLFSLLLVIVFNILVLLIILYCFGVLSLRGYAHDLADAARQMYESICALVSWGRSVIR